MLLIQCPAYVYPGDTLVVVCPLVCLFRQNTYLQNKKHTLTCQVGLVVTDLITSPVVSWEGWETPPPPSTEAQLSFFAQPPAW